MPAKPPVFTDAFAEIKNEPLATAGGVTSSRRAIICPDENGEWHEVGVVSNDYNLVPNSFVYQTALDILETAALEYEEMAPQFDGSRYAQRFRILNADYQYETRRKGDIVAAVLNVVNSYDGSTKFGAQLDLIRLACTNGMTMSHLLGGFRFKHNSSDPDEFNREVVAAANQLIGVGEKVGRIMPYLGKMQETHIGVRSLYPLFEQIGLSGDARNKVMKSIAEDTIGTTNSGDTLWDVYNGITSVLAGPQVKGFGMGKYATAATNACLAYVSYRN